jgi:toxin ParE1/3/4
VAGVRFSRRAEADLEQIGRYTLETWGLRQAVQYLSQIENTVSLLGGNPGLGRVCNEVRPGLLRFECGSHVLFYRRLSAADIVITRILHRNMVPVRHPFEDEPDQID